MSEHWFLSQLSGAAAVPVLISLLVNAVVTFGVTTLLALWLARLCGSPRMAKFILMAPWARLGWGLLCGVPTNAYVLSDHFDLLPVGGSEMRVQIGVGEYLLPTIQLYLEMKGYDGRWYSYSAGDMTSQWLMRTFEPGPIQGVVISIALVSAALAALRVYRIVRWNRRNAHVAVPAEIQVLREGVRRIRVFTAEGALLRAHTSGIFRPYIWLPANLSKDERRAVLEHELAHVRDVDVFWFGLVGMLTDIFWFNPIARMLEQRIQEKAEESADAAALARGARAKALASGILSTASLGVWQDPAPGIRGATLALERRLLAIASRRKRHAWRSAMRAAAAGVGGLSLFLTSIAGYPAGPESASERSGEVLSQRSASKPEHAGDCQELKGDQP